MNYNIFKKVNSYLYILISILLLLFSIILIISSVYTLLINIFWELWEENIILAVLQSVWAIIIWAAITDVAKYMYEEEVMKGKEISQIEDAKETLTKIVVIISIAVYIEGLIYIFKAWLQDIKLLIYPAFLIISSTIMIIWLWLYSKLTSWIHKKERK